MRLSPSPGGASGAGGPGLEVGSPVRLRVRSPPLSCLDGQSKQVGEDRRWQLRGEGDQGGLSGGATGDADVALTENADGLAR
jgi:hypothetical protein